MAVPIAGEADNEPRFYKAQDVTASEVDDFVAFYRAYARRVRGLVRRRIADPDLADDIVQDTFLRASAALDTFDRGRPVWPWLATIANNLCIDALRRTARRVEHRCDHLDERLDRPDWEADPAERYHSLEQRRGIEAALDTLGHRQRRILTLKELDGWRVDDLARMEGISSDAAKSLLTRARRSFRASYAALTETSPIVVLGPAVGAMWRRLRSTASRMRPRSGLLGPAQAIATETLAGLAALSVVTAVVGIAVLPGLATRAASRPHLDNAVERSNTAVNGARATSPVATESTPHATPAAPAIAGTLSSVAVDPAPGTHLGSAVKRPGDADRGVVEVVVTVANQIGSGAVGGDLVSLPTCQDHTSSRVTCTVLQAADTPVPGAR